MCLIVDIKKKLHEFNLEVNFEINKNTLGLIGPSGSGKSMILKCITGIEKPDSGRIILNDRILFDSKKRINIPIRDRKVGYLFQNYALFPHLTVKQNIAFGLKRKSKIEIIEKVNEIISIIKLNEIENRYPMQISGGQQQRVALARALIINPEILLFDEPFSALDEYLRNEMIKNLNYILSEYKGNRIFVTHNIEEAYTICKDIIVLSKGKIKSNGSKKDIFNNPLNIDSAKITGFKNISRIKILSSNTIEALDWGLKLKVNNNRDEGAFYVGIRSNDITISDNSSYENTAKCQISYISETPFRVTVYLKNEDINLKFNDYNLQWEVSKEDWDRIKDIQQPLNIQLKSDKLVLLK